MKRENNLVALVAILSILVFALIARDQQHYGEAKKYKGQVEKLTAEKAAYKDEALKSQVQYEGARNENQNLQRDLADAQERLAEAAERERAAKVRASRSRSAEPAKLPDQQRGGDSVFRGSVRDITKYCPTGNRTASGKWPREGMVATISRSIPFGTHVLIEGLGEFVVEDRIGHGSEFDIFTPSCAEARRFGREHRRVTILDVD